MTDYDEERAVFVMPSADGESVGIQSNLTDAEIICLLAAAIHAVAGREEETVH